MVCFCLPGLDYVPMSILSDDPSNFCSVRIIYSLFKKILNQVYHFANAEVMR